MRLGSSHRSSLGSSLGSSDGCGSDPAGLSPAAVCSCPRECIGRHRWLRLRGRPDCRTDGAACSSACTPSRPLDTAKAAGPRGERPTGAEEGSPRLSAANLLWVSAWGIGASLKHPWGIIEASLGYRQPSSLSWQQPISACPAQAARDAWCCMRRAADRGLSPPLPTDRGGYTGGGSLGYRATGPWATGLQGPGSHATAGSRAHHADAS